MNFYKYMENIQFLNSYESTEINYDLINFKSDFDDLNSQKDFTLFFKGLNNITFTIPKFICHHKVNIYKSKNNYQKKKFTKKYLKDRNKESSKRYRQRHKLIYNHFLKENEDLKLKISEIMDFINNNLCSCCMNINTNITKKDLFIIQKNK